MKILYAEGKQTIVETERGLCLLDGETEYPIPSQHGEVAENPALFLKAFRFGKAIGFGDGRDAGRKEAQREMRLAMGIKD